APDDAGVKPALVDLQKAQAAAQAQADAAAKRKQQFDNLLSTGKKALDEKRYDEAVKLLGDAAALMPGDPTNANLLKQAQQQQLASKTAADQAAKKAAFDQAIKQGQDFLAAKKYDEAIKAFQQAGTYLPGDATAAALLKQAEKARTDAANAAGNAAQIQAEFN